MVPNGSAYANFPSFANNGTKTPPGGSTESAKYALGMVPADTFPAEWANYLFHGATAGITRLNQDTGSIKKEINTVLDNFNITPDATLNNQLLEALNKLKADAALAAHPVGSLYWTSVNENPAITFGGGTWAQIKDKFILAAGDTYTNGGTGGAATVTLTTEQMPNHTHRVTCSGTVGSKTAGGSISGGAYKFTGSSVNTGGMSGNATGNIRCYGNDGINGNFSSGTGAFGTTVTATVDQTNSGSQKSIHLNVSHSHSVTASGTISVTTNPTFTGTSHDHTFTGSTVTSTATGGPNGATSGEASAHENMPPYIVKYCWERTA